MFSLLRKCIFFFCLGFCITPALAAIQTASMLVSVNVMPGCIITATPLVFGLYTPYAAISTKSIARLKLLCTLNTPYNIALDQGSGDSATTRLRSMSGPGTETIHYTLSQNPTHTINWGNTLGIDTAVGSGTGIKQYLTVYGEIPAKQNVSIGAYRDVVNVSIIF
ncbi:MAG: spore coat U domain-containing protein [Pseudomonadota bacterium]